MGCRNADLGKAAAAALAKEGCNVTFAQLDITDAQSISRFAQHISGAYGGLDILVNNAAIAFKGRDPTPFAQQARPTIQTNVHGTLAICDSLVPLLRPGGRIVNVASMSGPLRQFPRAARTRVLAPDFSRQELCALVESFVAAAERNLHQKEVWEKAKNIHAPTHTHTHSKCTHADINTRTDTRTHTYAHSHIYAHHTRTHTQGWPNTCYGVSKAALNAYTRILARELAPRQILVNSCCPGWCAISFTSMRST